MEDRGHLDLVECQALRGLMVQEDLLARGEHLEVKGCLEWKDLKEQQGLMVLPVLRVLLVPQALMEIEVFLVFQAQLDLLVSEGNKDPKEKEET